MDKCDFGLMFPLLVILFVVLVIAMSGVVFAYDIPNLDTIANPWTAEDDYFVDVNDLGADLNLSGNNLIVDNLTVTNNLTVYNRITSDNITAEWYSTPERKVMTTIGGNTTFYSSKQFEWYLNDGSGDDLAMRLVRSSPTSLNLFNSTLNVIAAKIQVYAGDPTPLCFTNLENAVFSPADADSINSIEVMIDAGIGSTFVSGFAYLNGSFVYGGNSTFPCIKVMFWDFRVEPASFNITAGSTVTLTYDGGQQTVVYMPEWKYFHGAPWDIIPPHLFISTDGSTFYDAELTQLAQPSNVSQVYTFYTEGNAFITGDITVGSDTVHILERGDINATGEILAGGNITTPDTVDTNNLIIRSPVTQSPTKSYWQFFNGTHSISESIDGLEVNFTTLNTSGQTLLAIGSGNVGIGTTSPGELLHIAGGDVRIDNNQALLFRDIADTGSLGLKADTSDRLTFRTGGAWDRMVIDSSGNIGIGTTAPNSKLEVFGNATFNLTVSGEDFSVVNGSGSSRFFIDNSNGNVGIGRAGPGAKLDVDNDVNNSAVNLFNDGQGMRVVNHDTTDGSYSSLKLETRGDHDGAYIRGINRGNNIIDFSIGRYTSSGSTSNDWLTILNGGNVGIGTTAPGYLLEIADTTGDGDSLNVSNVLYVNGSSGNVGIGTTAPGAKLEISDDTRTTGGTLRLTNAAEGSAWVAGDEIGSIGFYVTDTSSVGTYSKIIAVSEGAGPQTYPIDTGLAFYTTTNAEAGLTEQVRIDNNGNVGIGTTAPAEKLHVVGGDIAIGKGQRVKWNGTTNENSIRFQNTFTPNFRIMLDGTDRFTIANGTGNVGIGTTSPTSHLSIGVAVVNTISTDSSDASDTKLLRMAGGGVGGDTRGGYIDLAGNEHASDGDITIIAGNDASGGDIAFYTQATQRVVIDYDGNVGIGTTTPASKLVVAGAINVTNNISLSSDDGTWFNCGVGNGGAFSCT